ncbi:MAG: hypothetical protein R3F54_06210 [Alphaproteobacteria bacterium]
MTPLSLMPPIDYCSSCEGRKAERQAVDIGEARARKAESKAAADAQAPPPGAMPAEAGNAATPGQPEPVTGSVPSLLAPDLAVQAALGRPSIDATGGEDAALRLRTARAYGLG